MIFIECLELKLHSTPQISLSQAWHYLTFLLSFFSRPFSEMLLLFYYRAGDNLKKKFLQSLISNHHIILPFFFHPKIFIPSISVTIDSYISLSLLLRQKSRKVGFWLSLKLLCLSLSCPFRVHPVFSPESSFLGVSCSRIIHIYINILSINV